jgi:hypothetical protein
VSADETVFHVEVRQFPHAASAFNLSREQLEARIVGPWLSGRPVEMEDRRFSPERAKVTIIEGPSLSVDEMGLGRGWANAQRDGQDVTVRIFAEAQAETTNAPRDLETSAEEFKTVVVGACTLRRLSFGEVVLLASARHPGSRASERLALAERAVWELLHQRRIELFEPDGDEPVAPAGWQAIVLSWESWSGSPQPEIQAAAVAS